MEIVKPRLFLCKPNRSIIADLTRQAYNVNYSQKLGNVSELTFNLPLFIDIEHEVVQNKDIDKVKHNYLIKFQINNTTEWFVIKNPISNMGEDIDEFIVECFSLPYTLNNYLIRSYSVESKTLSQIGNDLLKNTNWSLGYVNSSFDIKYRSFDVNSDTVLSTIMELATTFNAIIRWDSENREINFYKPEQIGNYNGLNFDYGKYLKEINKSLNVDDFCTRLRIYGKDNLMINEYNITGTNYLDNFGYFIYPYEEDEFENVIKSSHYMSDGLCSAIIKYNKLLEIKKEEFEGYIHQKDIYNGELYVLNGDLLTLNGELNVILDSLDMAQSSGQNSSDLWQQKTNKELEIQNKTTAINNKKTQINNEQTNINTLGLSLSMENNFTEEQLIELNDYIVEKTVENQHIFDTKELLEWGKEEFEKINIPQIMIEINSIDIDQFLDLDCRLDRGKLILGDIIKIKHKLFNIDVEAKIIEINTDYESGESGISISNIEHIDKDINKFIKKINQAISTSTTVDMEKFKWNSAVWELDEVSKILNNTWDATEREINSGVNNSVITDRRGITVYSIDNPDKLVRIVAGTIGVSGDGGKTYHQAITGDGIYGERIISNIIASSDLTITNTDGSFLVNENGVVLDGMSLEITGGLPLSEIDAEGIVLENNLYNGVKISTTEGLVVTRNDNKIRSVLNAINGLSIEKWENSQWNKKLYADVDGNLLLKGHLEIGSGNSIFKADNNGIYLGNSSFQYAPFRVSLSGSLIATSANIQGAIDCSSLKIAGTDILDSLNKIKGDFLSNGSVGASKLKVDELIVGQNIQMGSNAYISWSNVSGKPSDLAYKSDIPTVPSYITSTKITQTTIESPNITGGSITSNTTINVGTDVTIGRNLNLSVVQGNGGIKWDGYGEIFMDLMAKTLVLYGNSATQIGSYNGNTIIRGNVSFPDSGGVTAVFG